jgi:hypothetical protein
MRTVPVPPSPSMNVMTRVADINHTCFMLHQDSIPYLNRAMALLAPSRAELMMPPE